MGELRDTWDGLKDARSKTGIQTNLDDTLTSFIDSLVTAVEASGSGSSNSGYLIKQGDYDPFNTEALPTSDDTIGTVPIKKGFAWELLYNWTIYKAGGFIIANKDNPENTSEDWDFISGEQQNGTIIIQEDYDYSETETFPNQGNVLGGGPIKKGYAWRSSVKYENLVDVGDLFVANKDGAEDTTADWNIIRVDGSLSPNLIAQAYHINGENTGETVISGFSDRQLVDYIITHIALGMESGSWDNMEFNFHANATNLLNNATVTGMVSGVDIIYPITVSNQQANFSRIVVTSGNGSELLFNIKVYGYHK